MQGSSTSCEGQHRCITTLATKSWFRLKHSICWPTWNFGSGASPIPASLSLFSAADPAGTAAACCTAVAISGAGTRARCLNPRSRQVYGKSGQAFAPTNFTEGVRLSIREFPHRSSECALPSRAAVGIIAAGPSCAVSRYPLCDYPLLTEAACGLRLPPLY
jgi:hypothetical protein